MRKKGTGSICQLKSGYWVGSVEAGRYPNGGRRKIRIVRKDKAEVVEAMEELATIAVQKSAENICVAELGGYIDPHGHHVYCLWGDDDYFPLYIGRSSNILARLGNHMVNPTKRAAIQRVSIIRRETSRGAAALEEQLIRLYKPEWNKRGIA